MAKNNPIGTCGLCRAPGVELQDSHVLPKWCYKRIREPSLKNPNPMRVTDAGPLQTSEQIKKPFLCWDCEQRFGRWEGYVSQITYQPDGSFPAMSAVTVPPNATETLRVVPSTGLDYERLFRFAVSIVWRADVMATAPKSGEKSRGLGERYREVARQYLLGSGAPPGEIHVVLLLLVEQPGLVTLSRAFSLPTSGRLLGCHLHFFALCGLEFWVGVGGAPHPVLQDLCLLRGANKEVALIPQRMSMSVKGMIKKIADIGPRQGR